MLVLSRKYQDTIVIDQRIRIKVLAIRGDRIRLGIEAPDDVAILRGELTLRTTADETDCVASGCSKPQHGDCQPESDHQRHGSGNEHNVVAIRA
jgi:carbon storage regulator